MLINLLPIEDNPDQKTKTGDSERFAENHGQFMFDVMNLDGSSPAYYFLQQDTVKRFDNVPAGRGLFVLFVTPAYSESPKLPIYVGKTKQTFVERLEKLKLIEDLFLNPEGGYRLGVSVSKLSLPVAVFMKHFFLEEFNFSMNSKENAPKRRSIESDPQYQRNESAEKISKKWRECLGEITNLKDKFQVVVYESVHERKLRQEMQTLRQDMQDLQEQIRLINQRLDNTQT